MFRTFPILVVGACCAATVPLSAQPTLTINGVEANYSVSNFYIDELRDTAFPEIEILFAPNEADLTAIEIFTNLNHRDRANDDWNGDGVEDGIIPPDGNSITTADTEAYFRTYAMEDVGGGSFRLVLPVERTGAYRMTGRWKVSGDDSWHWYSSDGRRDHAIVVAPRSALDMRMYELHVTNVDATGDTFADRSTFEDLHDGVRWDLGYLNSLGLNWIWFQPFHPQGIDGRETDPGTGQAYDPGSPYAIRNYFQINSLYSNQYDGTRDQWEGEAINPVDHPDNVAAAMTAFQDFAAASDNAGVNLMLDFPFNHTAPDVVFGDQGLEIFDPDGTNGWDRFTEIRDVEARFFSRDASSRDEFGNSEQNDTLAYSLPASNASTIAVAPDRNDFGKWNDVRDVFFGRYATLVSGFPAADTSRNTTRDEGDWFDYTSFAGTDGAVTLKVWRFFGEVLPYWIEQSGHTGNTTSGDGDLEARAQLEARGIDGLRKDFGQGLPPQCMEYIINRTHEAKWNFVFMTESLDGGEVTYRSSRHFAVLNENIVFPFQAATDTSAYRGIFESRRGAYGRSLVLLNNMSHDEESYTDPWQAVVKFSVASTVDGVPMIFYGQELGISRTYGFQHYETNFGKQIAHFKRWNSIEPIWTDTNFGNDQLFPVYAAINRARAASPALRSFNRWYLNRKADGNPSTTIFAVGKYETPQGSPAFHDVVLAFANVDRDEGQADLFDLNAQVDGRNVFGILPDRIYNVRNLSAYTARDPSRDDTWLWGSGVSGADLLTNGLFVGLNRVPQDDPSWSTDPFEVQYLKLYDVTPPPAPGTVIPEMDYSFGAISLHRGPASPGPDDHIVGYRVKIGTAPGLGDVVDTETGNPDSFATFHPVETDTVLYAEVEAISVAGIGSGPGPSSTAPVVVLSRNGDWDGDRFPNAIEDAMGSDPLDPLSQKHPELHRDTSGNWVVRFGRREDLTGTAITIFSNHDLGSTWSFSPVSGAATATNGDGTETVEAILADPGPGETGPFFIRLRADPLF